MLNDNIRIIEFQSRYANQVILLIDSILKELGVIQNTEVIIDDEDLFKIPEIYSGKGKFWIALDGDVVVGTVAIRDLKNGHAKLNRMFVHTHYRGTGLGQKLLDTALEFSRAHGFKDIVLNTHLLMHRAHNFYEKNGFEKTHSDNEKHHYKLVFSI